MQHCPNVKSSQVDVISNGICSDVTHFHSPFLCLVKVFLFNCFVHMKISFLFELPEIRGVITRNKSTEFWLIEALGLG